MPPNSPFTFEVCLETAAGLATCGGHVDRIELCSGLELGGLTPSAGLMQAARQSGLETHVLIRPRTGGFEYDATDIATMLADIATVRNMGLHGVVIGASRGGSLDIAAMTQMIAAAGDLEVTLHRVIDVLDAPLSAVDQAADLGVTRILCSGGAATALLGIAGLAALHSHAAGRIEVMAGSGVNSANVRQIAAQTGVTSFHASCCGKAPLNQTLKDLNFGKTHQFTDPAEVIAMRAALSD